MTHFTHICCSHTRWLVKHFFYSPKAPPTWRVVNILLTGQLLLLVDCFVEKSFLNIFYSAGIWFGKRHKDSIL